jgi:alpha-ketoglutarate-dependent taurine dioxygenase
VSTTIDTTITERLPVVDAHAFALPVPDNEASFTTIVRAAGHATRLLPPGVHDALVDFTDAAPHAGALLLRHMPIGDVGPTPPTPLSPVRKDRTSEMTLLTVARRLGQPVGYMPEHGGDLIQNIVPTKTAATRQVSTSSRTELMFHTEAAFHPHRPRYLLLLCLRGDLDARTTLTSINDVLPHLPADVVELLFQPRFRTAVDESYLHGRNNALGSPMPVLSGDRQRPSMVFDADLMVGIDAAADDALRSLERAVADQQRSITLASGDLLVVDNNTAVHGRTPFTPRFDGTDRWLQRTFVVADLAPSAGERTGRVITTSFGAD